MLRAVSLMFPSGIEMIVFDGIGELPVFSPDLERENTPDVVRAFMQAIAKSDGLIVASPEYVRSIPGGLKNAIDWLVSGEQIIGKPLVLGHASHRGDDMLATLRLVLSTVTENFNANIFLRLPLIKETPEAIEGIFRSPDTRGRVADFLNEFSQFCRRCANRHQPLGQLN
jgi:NAD(P)H-dependent FMN reductase